MSVNIKLEKVVNDDGKGLLKDYVITEEFNTISSQNENFKLLLSYNKIKCDEQLMEISELNKKKFELDESIHHLQNQILLLKQSNQSSSNIISEKDNYLNCIYQTINKMDIYLSGKSQISDPKSATRKLNQFQYMVKDLQNKITSNKILIMTMCKVLDCDSSKIIQSMKDLINENELLKRKCKQFENFYQSAVTLTKNMSFELHRNGHEKSLAAANENLCQFHLESIDFWNKKMANTRYQLIQNKDKNSHLIPTYNPVGTDFKHKVSPNSGRFQINANVNNPPPSGFITDCAFNQYHIPPPSLQKNYIQYPLSLYGINMNGRFAPGCSSSQVEYSCNLNDKSIPPAQFLKASSNKYFENTGFKKSNKVSKTHLKSSDTNVYDWKNFSIKEGKRDLLRNENQISDQSLHDVYQSQKRTCKNKDWGLNSNNDSDVDVKLTTTTSKKFKHFS